MLNINNYTFCFVEFVHGLAVKVHQQHLTNPISEFNNAVRYTQYSTDTPFESYKHHLIPDIFISGNPVINYIALCNANCIIMYFPKFMER